MNTIKPNILVTGGAGYIGSHTVISLLESGFCPIIIDDLRNTDENAVKRIERVAQEKVVFYDINCQDKQALNRIFNAHAIDGVIHFAADKAVGESVQNPLKYFENNISALVTILEVMEANEINDFVFSSSCTVYGEPEKIPVDEQSPLSYSSPYGYTKLVGEQMLKQYNSCKNNFHYVALRYFNPIGAHESAEIGEVPRGIPNNLLPYITQTAVGERAFLTVFGNDYDTPDGTCIRDYIHVMDLADAHVAALNYLRNKDGAIENEFNIGTGKGTSVKELIDIFESACNMKLPHKIGARRDGDVPMIYARTEKAKRLLNWESKRSVTEAVESAWRFEQKRRSNEN
jgi:UDP-glucose 4-epimerase